MVLIVVALNRRRGRATTPSSRIKRPTRFTDPLALLDEILPDARPAVARRLAAWTPHPHAQMAIAAAGRFGRHCHA